MKPPTFGLSCGVPGCRARFEGPSLVEVVEALVDHDRREHRARK